MNEYHLHPVFIILNRLLRFSLVSMGGSAAETGNRQEIFSSNSFPAHWNCEEMVGWCVWSHFHCVKEPFSKVCACHDVGC